MSIFNIDWNSDGKIDSFDTAMDFMLIDDLEREEKRQNEEDYDFFDNEDE